MESLLQKPLDRIASGWKIAYLPEKWWVVAHITSAGKPTFFREPAKALAQYLRLTAEARQARERKGEGT